MSAFSEAMRRRRVSFMLKLLGALFILIVLIRSDWLAAIFLYNTHQLKTNEDIRLLPDDTAPDFGTADNGISLLRQMMQEKSSSQKVDCPIPSLKNLTVDSDQNPPLCTRIKPEKSSCQMADVLFGDPMKLDIDNACESHLEKTYCKLKGSSSRWKAYCDAKSCDKTWFLTVMDARSCDMKSSAYKSVIELENRIEHLISNKNLGFCLISCFESMVDNYENFEESQILTLPPQSQGTNSDQLKDFVNINMIFIDSVSRHHFFRSLPRSVSVMKELASREDFLVLDFEKVQGVRSRTYETLQTLFSGKINPFEIPFGTQEMPSEKLHVEELFKLYKELGYSTLWIEDLCPYWEWGLAKDLLVYSRGLNKSELHRKFLSATKNAGIDSVGNTFSSCSILKLNGVNDPFHGPDKLCHNGLHQHEYLLEYLQKYNEEKVQKKLPYISFFETNIGHEDSGRRIQYFDLAFKEYIRNLSSINNTLTVIFSDHGNAYGEFVKKETEGRIEMYHPFVFMIIPKQVLSFFTANQLHSLQENQLRLISVLDLHYTLTYIVENIQRLNEIKSESSFSSQVSDFNQQFNVSKEGLLADISKSRTCSHVPRVMPNLCICEGYDTAVSGNQGFHEILALYFIGTINNEILKQRQSVRSASSKQIVLTGGFGHCRRLMLDQVKNIQESHLNDKEMVAKMDLYVNTPGQNSAEIFFISVHVKQGSTISLGSFDRITPYSRYSVCADKNVETKLCVCDIEESIEFEFENNMTDEFYREEEPTLNYDSFDLNSLMYSSFDNEMRSYTVAGEECLHIVSHGNSYGLVLEAVSTCKINLLLIVKLNPVQLMLSTESNIRITMLPKDIKFLTAGVRKNKKKWSCSFDVYVQQ